MAPRSKTTTSTQTTSTIASHAAPADQRGVPITQWRALYRLAEALRALAPWTWMMEDQHFAVRHPQSGELGIVSVMGNLGEHLSVAIYLGAAGLRGYHLLANAKSKDDSFEAFMTQRALQISFEDRAQLEPEDLRLIKDLGLKYRGPQAWPLFRSQHPGYLPWYLEPAEATFLELALAQILLVTPRLQAEPTALESPGKMLCRAQRDGGWVDEWIPLPAPAALAPAVAAPLDPKLAAALASSTKPRQGAWQIECSLTSAFVAEKGQRPYPSQVLLVVDEASGFILGIHMMKPAETALKVADQLAQVMLSAPMTPKQLQVRRADVLAWISPVAKAAGIPVVLRPKLDAAREALRAVLSGM